MKRLPQKGTIRMKEGSVHYERISQRFVGASSSPVLIVGLHGFGIDESQIRTLIGLPNLETTYSYVALRGFYELGDGTYGWFPIQVLDGKPVVADEDVEAASRRLGEALGALGAEVGSDPERTFLVGYSQGGALAIQHALTSKQTVAGTAAFAGAVLPAALRLDHINNAPLFIGHGTLDSAVTIEDVRIGVQAARDRGADITFREYRVPHVVSAQQREDLQAWLVRQVGPQEPKQETR